MKDFFQQITTSSSDEWYSPQSIVDMIVPYILKSGYKKIWCPFDMADSNFVMTFKDKGLDVTYGHICTGQDFFNYEEPQGEIVVSNPPYSKRNEIFQRLYEMNVPFALVMNFNGLFDSKKRLELFKQHGIEIIIPRGRMKFVQQERGYLKSPNFQSVYVCNKLLNKQIVFDETTF